MTKIKNVLGFIKYFFKNSSDGARGGMVILGIAGLIFLMWLGMANAILIFIFALTCLALVFVVLTAFYYVVIEIIETHSKWKRTKY